MCENKVYCENPEYNLLTEDRVQFGGYRRTKGDKRYHNPTISKMEIVGFHLPAI